MLANGAISEAKKAFLRGERFAVVMLRVPTILGLPRVNTARTGTTILNAVILRVK